MARLREDRLRRLEAAMSASETDDAYRAKLEAYFCELENYRREELGLPPLPYEEPEYTEEDAARDWEVVEEFRTDLGSQSEEAQARLDEWEQDIVRRLISEAGGRKE